MVLTIFLALNASLWHKKASYYIIFTFKLIHDDSEVGKNHSNAIYTTINVKFYVL